MSYIKLIAHLFRSLPLETFCNFKNLFSLFANAIAEYLALQYASVLGVFNEDAVPSGCVRFGALTAVGFP